MRKFAFFLLLSVSGAPLFANAGGAEPRLSSAPGEGTCLNCHGDGLNYGRGSVTLSFANGNSYVPGQKQRVTVTVADPSARAWGFEASSRVGTTNTGAGTIESVDGTTQLLTVRNSGTLQWITHTRAGTRVGTTGLVKFEFDWTPPATDVGEIHFYASGNAANGNSREDTGDQVYATDATLSPQSTGNKPVISQGGATNAFSNLATRLGPGTWASLYGSNLAATTRVWGESDFSGNIGPTRLDGVTATVNGKAAAINFVSPGQVNIQIPTDAGVGSSSIVVTNVNGASDSFPVTLTPFAPGLLAPAAFRVQGRQYVVAQFADGVYVGPPGLIAGLTFRPAKAGDTVIIYGVGFGPLSSPVGTGQVVQGLNATASPVRFTLGSASVTPAYAGAAPGFVGAYQFNLVIPPNLGAGDVAIDASVGGVSTGQSLYFAVQ